MNPPFTADQFLEVFRRYHESVGPAPIALTALGLFIAATAYRADLRRSWPWAQTALVLLRDPRWLAPGGSAGQRPARSFPHAHLWRATRPAPPCGRIRMNAGSSTPAPRVRMFAGTTKQGFEKNRSPSNCHRRPE